MCKNLIRKGHIREKYLGLLKLNLSASQIARGIALGVFIGIIPIYGLHTIIAIVLAMLVPRTNRIAILLGTNISMPMTLPFIVWAGYNLGRIVTRGDYPLLRLAKLRNLDYQDIPGLYKPLFLESIFLGIICSVVFYILVYMIAKKMEEKKTMPDIIIRKYLKKDRKQIRKINYDPASLELSKKDFFNGEEVIGYIVGTLNVKKMRKIL